VAQTRIHFSHGDVASFFIAGSAAIFAGSLTLVTFWMDSKMLEPILLVPLFPGLLVAVLITGAHGGTVQQETWAPWIGAFVNAVIYAVAVLLIRFIWRWITLKYAHQAASNHPKETT